MPLDLIPFPEPSPEPTPANDGNPFAKYDTPDSPILFPVAERKVGWQMKDGSYMPTTTHKALVRVDPRNPTRAFVINVVTDTYKLIHNRELFSVIQQAMLDHVPLSNLMGVQVTDRESGYGTHCYREYVFPNLRCKIGGSARSDIGFRIITQNGYGGAAIKLYAGAIEFYCTNGMIRGLHSSTYRRHTSGCHVYNLDKLITGAVKTFTNAQPLWESWAKTPVTHAKTMEFFRAIARSPTLLDKFAEHYERECQARGQTMWTVYSTLTYYASHGGAGEMFSVRQDQGENFANIMHERELDVARWVEGDKFKALADS